MAESHILIACRRLMPIFDISLLLLRRRRFDAYADAAFFSAYFAMSASCDYLIERAAMLRYERMPRSDMRCYTRADILRAARELP